MIDQRTDQIARHAARLIQTGRAGDIAQAIRTAADSLGYHDAPLPTRGLVRRHVQGMAMQALGERAYTETILDVWRTAEAMMTVIEEALPDCATMLAGRPAKGHIDAGVTLHIRAYTARPMRDIVETLLAYGYGEPAFETAHTRLGRLDRIRFDEDPGEVVITRCLPEMRRRSGVDLFNLSPIETATLEDLRRRLADGGA